jgi:histidinol phosphatase-like enzyme (inositol monophosphatase family)
MTETSGTLHGGTLLSAVHDLARAVGDAALARFRTGLAVETKADGSPVTAADRDAETLARAWLTERFPADGVLGEEHGALRPDARRVWIIDPIDGTKAFVRGVPLWATLIAVAEGETILAGAVYCPAAGELVAAAAGEGAWWNGARCAVSATASLERATILTSDDRFLERPDRGGRWTALGARVAVARTWGDGFGYLMVATGRAEAMLDSTMNVWDAAAPYAIVTEAGGRFTDWTGRATAHGGGGIATNAVLASAIRAALVESP